MSQLPWNPPIQTCSLSLGQHNFPKVPVPYCSKGSLPFLLISVTRRSIIDLATTSHDIQLMKSVKKMDIMQWIYKIIGLYIAILICMYLYIPIEIPLIYPPIAFFEPPWKWIVVSQVRLQRTFVPVTFKGSSLVFKAWTLGDGPNIFLV